MTLVWLFRKFHAAEHRFVKGLEIYFHRKTSIDARVKQFARAEADPARMFTDKVFAQNLSVNKERWRALILAVKANGLRRDILRGASLPLATCSVNSREFYFSHQKSIFNISLCGFLVKVCWWWWWHCLRCRRGEKWLSSALCILMPSEVRVDEVSMLTFEAWMQKVF